jgi:hypothetical protein
LRRHERPARQSRTPCSRTLGKVHPRLSRATPKRPGGYGLAIGRAFGMPSDSPICNRNRPCPRRARASLGNRRISSRAFGWKITGRTLLYVSDLRHRVRSADPLE